mgnify:CR=1 FL=1
MYASRVHGLEPMVDILSEILCEQRFWDVRLYMYVETGSELLQNGYGSGVMPVAMTADVVGEVFNWGLSAHSYPFGA